MPRHSIAAAEGAAWSGTRHATPHPTPLLSLPSTPVSIPYAHLSARLCEKCASLASCGITFGDELNASVFGCSTTVDPNTSARDASKAPREAERLCDAACQTLQNATRGSCTCRPRPCNSHLPAKFLDGLGHNIYLKVEQIASIIARGRRPTAFSTFGNAIYSMCWYLEDVPQIGSIYCHQKNATAVLLARQAQWRAGGEYLFNQLECYQMPPLNRWFNLTPWWSPVHAGGTQWCPDVRVPITDARERNQRAFAQTLAHVQERYWEAAAARPQVPCTVFAARKRVIVVATHIRVGDTFIDREARSRAALTLVLPRVIRLAEHLDRLLQHQSPPLAMVLQLFTDLPYSASVGGIQSFFAQHAGLNFSFAHDSSTGSSGGLAARLPSGLKVRIVANGNPLEAWHCMAAADLLIFSTSYFPLSAALFNRGTKLYFVGKAKGHMRIAKRSTSDIISASKALGQPMLVGDALLANEARSVKGLSAPSLKGGDRTAVQLKPQQEQLVKQVLEATILAWRRNTRAGASIASRHSPRPGRHVSARG